MKGDQQQSHELFAPRPQDNRVSHVVGLLEHEPEQRSDESGAGAGDERQQRKHEQTAWAVRAFDLGLSVARHCRPRTMAEALAALRCA